MTIVLCVMVTASVVEATVSDAFLRDSSSDYGFLFEQTEQTEQMTSSKDHSLQNKLNKLDEQTSEDKYEVCRPAKQFYEDHERGWFWKETCKKVKKKRKYRTLETLTVNIPWDIIDKLHPDEIRNIEREARAIAIMNPTRKNVIEWQRLMKYISSKSETFMKVAYLISRTSPEFELPPVSIAARDIIRAERQRKFKEILESYKDRAGLVVVVKEDCPFCAKQKVLLKIFADRYGWSYKLVDMYENPAFATNMGTQKVPDIFLVLNRDGKPVWQRIGTGLHTVKRLEEAVIIGLYMLGEIKDEKVVFGLY